MTAPHRSPSQVTQYERCPYAYCLQRVRNVWEKPAAWTAQGTAFHSAIEAYERGQAVTAEDMETVFRDVYAAEIGRLAAVTPNMRYWFDSRQGSGEADVERRHRLGLAQVRDYYEWRSGEGAREVVWVAEDGTPGIELGFNADFEGVPVRGYIDLVVEDRGRAFVRDAKSGNEPGDAFQLKTYAIALEDLYDVQVDAGDFWMGAKNGKHRGPTKPIDLASVPRASVIERYHAADVAIKAERFDPRPDRSVCWSCSVRSSCEYRAG